MISAGINPALWWTLNPDGSGGPRREPSDLQRPTNLSAGIEPAVPVVLQPAINWLDLAAARESCISFGDEFACFIVVRSGLATSLVGR